MPHGDSQVAIVGFNSEAWTQQSLTGIKPLGMITPFGGIAFLLGWLLLGIAAWQYPG